MGKSAVAGGAEVVVAGAEVVVAGGEVVVAGGEVVVTGGQSGCYGWAKWLLRGYEVVVTGGRSGCYGGSKWLLRGYEVVVTGGRSGCYGGRNGGCDSGRKNRLGKPWRYVRGLARDRGDAVFRLRSVSVFGWAASSDQIGIFRMRGGSIVRLREFPHEGFVVPGVYQTRG
jgi:krueppel-like factor 15